MADGEGCWVLLRAVPGARLELRLTQGQSHPSPLGREAGGSGNAGKVGACLFCIWVSKTRALQEEETEPMLPVRREIPFGLNLKKTPRKYKCSSCTSRVSGFQRQWDGDQNSISMESRDCLCNPTLALFPARAICPWHLCAASVSSSLCAVALAGGSSVRGVSPWTLSLHNRLFHLPICIVKGGYTVSPPSPPALEVAFVSR